MESQHNQKRGTGQLFIVATPIGNLEDITFRAVKTLQEVDLIAAEDTRVSRRLLERYRIKTPMLACHEHNEAAVAERLLPTLEAGEDVALISDAGTPLINDPGYRLVKLMREKGVRVTPIPGASSPVTALCAAGLPTDQFTYLGFPPRSGRARKALFEEIREMGRTGVLLESPHRLVKTLQDLQGQGMGGREICVARELTKLHESFVGGTIETVIDHYTQHPPKGEIVLVIGPAPALKAEDVSDAMILDCAAEAAMQALAPSARARAVAQRLGVSKSRVYPLISASG